MLGMQSTVLVARIETWVGVVIVLVVSPAFTVAVFRSINEFRRFSQQTIDQSVLVRRPPFNGTIE